MLHDVFEPVKIDSKQMGNYIEKYISSCTNKLHNTRQTYKIALLEFSNYFSNNEFLFLLENVEEFHNYLKEKGLKITTINTYIIALRRFSSFLVQTSIIPKNPFKRYKLSKIENNKNICFLTKKQSESLIKIIPDDLCGSRDKAIISLLLETGLTFQEIINLDMKDFFIYRRKWYIYPKEEIHDKTDKMLITNSTAEMINKYLVKLDKNLNELFPLFVSFSNRSQMKRLTSRGIKEIIIRRLNGSNLNCNEIKPSIIKNTAAVRLAADGSKPQILMDVFKIKKISTAMKYYDCINDYLNF